MRGERAIIKFQGSGILWRAELPQDPDLAFDLLDARGILAAELQYQGLGVSYGLFDGVEIE